jgi:hypothetical protein
MNADADRVGFHVAFPDDEHGVNFHLLGALNFAVDLVGAFVDLRAHLMSLGLGCPPTPKVGINAERRVYARNLNRWKLL